MLIGNTYSWSLKRTRDKSADHFGFSLPGPKSGQTSRHRERGRAFSLSSLAPRTGDLASARPNRRAAASFDFWSHLIPPPCSDTTDHVFNTPLITGLNTPLNTPKRQQNTGDHARTQPYFISTQRISRKFPVANHPGHPLSAVQRSSYWRGFAVIRGFLLRGLRRFVCDSSQLLSEYCRGFFQVLSAYFRIPHNFFFRLFQTVSGYFRLFQHISGSHKKKFSAGSASPQRGFQTIETGCCHSHFAFRTSSRSLHSIDVST
jgi:hypothetical protein